MEDLRYTEIQTSLFVYLLPICLEMWRNDMRGVDTSCAGVVEHFYPVLADRHVFDVHLTPKQTAVVSDFMRRAILERLMNNAISHFGAQERVHIGGSGSSPPTGSFFPMSSAYGRSGGR